MYSVLCTLSISFSILGFTEYLIAEANRAIESGSGIHSLKKEN